MDVSSVSALKVESRAIQRFYDEFLRGDYQVNRRYQRKLVWTLKQKQDLIDSIIKGLPLPLLLLARVDSSSESARKFEIVDGLQRLDAIVGYINNEFPWEGKYFNLETMASTKEREDNPDDDLVQQGENEGILGRDLSRRIANYELPFSIFETDSYSEIDEVFGRINSSGRLLSPQEVRQAGVLTDFAELVRSLSAQVRTDDTLKLILPLQEAPRFSLDFDDSGHGIDGRSIFWYRNGILKSDNLRSSLDEQLVADLVLDMLATNLTLNNDTRDSAYDPSAELGTLVGKRLSETGKVTSAAEVRSRFSNVMSVLADLEDELGRNTKANQSPRGAAIMRHLGLNLTNSSGRYFHTLFLAIDANLTKGNRLRSSKLLLDDLKGYFEGEKVQSGSNWQWQARKDSVNRLRKNIAEAFEPGDANEFVNSQNRLDFVKSRLSKLPHESELFELKQGLTELQKPSQKQIKKKIVELAKTATAMRNTHPADDAVILVGIVDNMKSMDALRASRGVEPIQVDNANTVSGVSIVGVEHDLDALGIELDKYIDIIKQALSSSSSITDTDFKRELVQGIQILPVRDQSPAGEFRHLIYMQVPKSQKVVTFDDLVYLRAGSSNESATYGQIEAIQATYRALPR